MEKTKKIRSFNFLNFPLLHYSNTPLGVIFRQSQLTLTPPIEDPAMRGKTWFSRTKLKQLGYDLEWVMGRVAEIYGIHKEDIYLKGRQKGRAEARSLLFYWAVRELDISGTSLAKRFEMSQPGIVYVVNKGEKIAKERNDRLLE